MVGVVNFAIPVRQEAIVFFLYIILCMPKYIIWKIFQAKNVIFLEDINDQGKIVIDFINCIVTNREFK